MHSINPRRKALRLILSLAVLGAGVAPHLRAQSSVASFSDRIYWGGGVSVAFWDYTAIRIEPLVGYRITSKLSTGAKVMYEYLRYERFGETVDSHSFGGSLFARYRFVEQLYAHLEYGGQSYEKVVDVRGNQERVAYPLFLLGVGFVQRTGKRTSLYFEVLYDVLQDDDSPYENGGPFLSIGVAVGF